MVDAVEVAMATYNGAKYLPEFLDSVATQTYANVTIIASDDGSDDATCSILGDHIATPLTLHHNIGPRGFSGNFANAISHTTAPYIALADQDDWWHPDKITLMVERAKELEAEHGSETPVLIFSDIEVVDEQLRMLRPSLFVGGAAAAGTLSFADYLFGNHVPGCAMLLNRASINRAMPIPTNVAFHDWWFSLVATGLGQVGVVDAPLIKYRQHGGNTLGAPMVTPSLRKRLTAKFGNPASQLRQRWTTVHQIGTMMAETLGSYQAKFGHDLPRARAASLATLLQGRPLNRLWQFRGVKSAGGRAVAVAVTLLLGGRLLPLPERTMT